MGGKVFNPRLWQEAYFFTLTRGNARNDCDGYLDAPFFDPIGLGCALLDLGRESSVVPHRMGWNAVAGGPPGSSPHHSRIPTATHSTIQVSR